MSNTGETPLKHQNSKLIINKGGGGGGQCQQKEIAYRIEKILFWFEIVAADNFVYFYFCVKSEELRGHKAVLYFDLLLQFCIVCSSLQWVEFWNRLWIKNIKSIFITKHDHLPSTLIFKFLIYWTYSMW